MGDSRDPLDTVLFAFVAQTGVLILLSFTRQVDLVFTHKIFFQFDFFGYYTGLISFMAGGSPYPSMFSPPSALVVIFPFGFFSFPTARLIYFISNLSLFLYVLTRFAREIGLERRQISNLQLITLLYFPFQMLADRGNVDGLLVAFAVLAFLTRGTLIRGLLLGLSVAIKLYSGLLVLVLFRRREFRLAFAAGLFFILLQLPFLRYEFGFFHILTSRGSDVRLFGNLSPYVLFNLFIGQRAGVAAYLLFWCGTFTYRLVRDRSARNNLLWVDYIPWMITLPLFVVPYEGVFLLPLLAVFARRFKSEDFSGVEGLLIPGFILTGFQPIATTSLFGVGRAYFELINIVGLMLILVAVCFARSPRPDIQPNEKS